MIVSHSLRVVLGICSLVALVGILWAIAAACDASGVRYLKWLVIGSILSMSLFMVARKFLRDVDTYRDALRAYARLKIDTIDLPSEFRFITHETTLADVSNRLGLASRVTELALPHCDGDVEHFMAHEYDLPYEAAVIVMPQRPFEPDDKIRAVSLRKRPNEDELFAPARS
jgi:hypothetical protein